MSTYGGSNIFGRSVTVDMVPEGDAVQVSAFFGVSGTFSLWGGNRGRQIVVTGLLYASDFPGLASAEAEILSYADGVGRDLYDSVRDVTYPNVVFRSGFKRTAPPGYGAGGVLQPYSCIFYGLV